MKRAIVSLVVFLVLFAAILPGPAVRRLLLVAGRRRGRHRLRGGGPRHLAALGALRRVRSAAGPARRPRTTGRLRTTGRRIPRCPRTMGAPAYSSARVFGAAHVLRAAGVLRTARVLGVACPIGCGRGLPARRDSRAESHA